MTQNTDNISIFDDLDRYVTAQVQEWVRQIWEMHKGAPRYYDHDRRLALQFAMTKGFLSFVVNAKDINTQTAVQGLLKALDDPKNDLTHIGHAKVCDPRFHT